MLKDKTVEFLDKVANNPHDKFYIYYGLKAAPLTLAHEKIIADIKECASKFKNLWPIIGIAESEWKNFFHLDVMMTAYLYGETNRYRSDDDDIVLEDQDCWQGLYAWLQKHFYDGAHTMIVLGEDEWKHLEADDGVWKDVDKLTAEYYFHKVDRLEEISATKVREILYRDPDVDFYYVKDYISRWTYDYIKNNNIFWQLPPDFRTEENLFLKNYDGSKFKKPSVTLDNIAWYEEDNKKYIVLIRRGGHPYKGYWALPGGFLDVDKDNTLLEAAKRELFEETGISRTMFKNGEAQGFGPMNTNQVKAYGDMGTDPRGRIVDVVFETKICKMQAEYACADDDADELDVFDVENLPKMAFNHKRIIDEFFGLEQKSSRARYTLD